MRKFLVTIDGKQFDVAVEEINDNGAVTPAVTEIKKAAPQATPKAEAPVNKAPAGASGTKVNTPMPGMIKALSVADGATVKKGQTLYVLEAMKMDNDMPAPCDGTVSFKVGKGTNVDTGALVAVIS